MDRVISKRKEEEEALIAKAVNLTSGATITSISSLGNETTIA